MDERTIRLMLVEDNPADVRILRERLREPAAAMFEITEAQRLSDAVRLIDQAHVDVVLLDLSLPDAQGLETVRRMQAAATDVPIVVLTHRDDEAFAAEALRAGIQDYVVKGQYPGALLVRAVNYAIERKRAERHLAAQYGITKVLADAQSLDVAVPRILQTICRVLEWDWGAYWAVDDRGLRCTVTWSALDAMASFDAASRALTGEEVGESLPERVRRHQEPIWIADIATTTAPRVAVASASGLRGAFGFPVAGAHGPLGVMEFFCRQVRLPDNAVLSMMGGIGSQVGQFIERKRLEEERVALLERERQARQHAEAVSRLKDEFLSVLSHELRTPLNVVMGRVRMLKDLRLTAKERKAALDTVERNAEIQLRVVDDLLDISRIITGRMRIDRKELALAEVVRTAVEGVRPTAEAKALQLTIEVADEIPALMGDPARLHQVLWNLLSNAIKFTPRGGEIHVRVGMKAHDAEIRVSDTGEGISPEFVPRLFERFGQADGSPTRAHGGLGLGLAISKELVEAHGGTIEACSAGPGRGATFVVRLPVSTSKTVPAS